MARLDDIISGRSGYDCSAAASAKWSNGLGALSSSTFLVYKYIVRVCILCVCMCVFVCVRAYDDVARLCNCPSWNRPTDRIRLFYFIANAAPTIPTYFFLFTNPVHGNASMSTNCFPTIFYATMCVYTPLSPREPLRERYVHRFCSNLVLDFRNSQRSLRKTIWCNFSIIQLMIKRLEI